MRFDLEMLAVRGCRGGEYSTIVRELVRRSHSVLVRGEYLENSIAAVKTTLVSTVPNNKTKTDSTKDLNTNKACFSVNTGRG